MADHWDTDYKNIIPLPFVETVGVGQQAKVVKKNTREEMLEFLYSDESMMVYNNSQMIHAMANLFNISIFTFTYGPGGEIWSVVSSDPQMAKNAEISFRKWLPDTLCITVKIFTLILSKMIVALLRWDPWLVLAVILVLLTL